MLLAINCYIAINSDKSFTPFLLYAQCERFKKNYSLIDIPMSWQFFVIVVVAFITAQFAVRQMYCIHAVQNSTG